MNILDYFKPFSSRSEITNSSSPVLDGTAVLPVEQGLVTYSLTLYDLATFIGVVSASSQPAVLYTVQSLTAPQATQALINIGAAPASGSTDIVQLGQITLGTWKAAPVDIAYGGTGATNVEDARTALELGTAATKNVGVSNGQVAAGDDSRFFVINDSLYSVSHTGALSTASLGAGNVAIGPGALQSNTSGAQNTCVGYQALRLNSTGHDNVAQGVSALAANTTGVSNVSIGSLSMTGNTTGGGNVAVGYCSLAGNVEGTGNTAVGNGTLQYNVGYQDTVVGSGAGLCYGTVFGTAYGFGHYVTGAVNSTYLGANTLASAATVTNETVIGFGAYGAGSNTTTIGSTANTKVLINGVLQQTPMGMGSLPSASTAGLRTFVNNSSQALNSNAGAVLIIATTGSYTIPVWSDGTNWRIG